MWPGLDASSASKNLPTHVIAILKGHMKQERQLLQLINKQSPPQKINTSQVDK